MAAVPLTTIKDTHAPDALERASDWANPILVKEVRQAVKSRSFIGAFFLLLLGAWLFSAFGWLMAGPAVEYGRLGSVSFLWYLGALCEAVFVGVPFSAFRSLLTERDDNTYELLSITTLTPGQIVRGKWACALVQTLLLYSAIAPFVAFTSLLQGFDVVKATLLLAGVFYVSAGLSLFALMLSTTVRARIWQGLLTLIVLVGLQLLMFPTVSLLVGIGTIAVPVDEPDFWWGLGVWTAVSASYLWLFYQVAASRLTFDAENRSTGIRITASAQFFLAWAAAAAYFIFMGHRMDDDVVIALTIVSGIHWGVLGMAFAAEPDGLSRRVRRTIPRATWLRPFVAPFLPGGARGYLFALLHLVILWHFAVIGWAWAAAGSLSGAWEPISRLATGDSDAWSDEPIVFATAVCCELALYLGLVAALARWGGALSAAFEGMHARMLVIILIAVGIAGPLGVRAGRFISPSDVSIADLTFPFWFLAEALYRQATFAQMATLGVLTLIVVGMNVPAVLQQFASVLAGPDARPIRSRAGAVAFEKTAPAGAAP